MLWSSETLRGQIPYGGFHSQSIGDQGGEPTLSQCYWVWNEIGIFQIHSKNRSYALNIVPINYNETTIFFVNLVCFIFFNEFLKCVVDKLSHKKWTNPRFQIAHSLQWTAIKDVASSSISLWSELPCVSVS